MDRVKPSRVVIDSLSEIRLLAQSSLRYRRQILSLKHYFAQRHATVLLLDDMTAEVDDKTVHSVAHAVVRLEELIPDYGSERRRLRVMKYRGQPFRGGYHDFIIKTGGVQVFPRLVAAEYRKRIKTSVHRIRQTVRRRDRKRIEHANHRTRRDRKITYRDDDGGSGRQAR
jgi:circadian clock protein KaiC